MKFTATTALSALALAIAPPAAAEDAAFPMTPDGAKAFVASAEQQLYAEYTADARADWINATYITSDTDALAADADARMTQLQVRLALEAAKYAKLAGLDPDVARKLSLLRTSIVLPAPTTPGAADELSQIATRLNSEYATGTGTLDGKELSGIDIEAEMKTYGHTPAEYKEMWTSWHDNVGPQMKGDYARMVEIANQGAQELGYANVGELWRSGYDMTPEEFSATTERLWHEVEPLYKALHTYVRWKLNEKYGDAVQPATGPIRADLLGNMWAQNWEAIYPLVAPKGSGDIGYTIADLLKANGKGPMDMIHYGANFYTSLGLQELPETFWQRSMFVKPQDREVVCHASAWDMNPAESDVRIKMCTKVNDDAFRTVHHELGHDYYFLAYRNQPYLYREGANDGFHEAIGDFIALSITPDYLVKIGLLDANKVPGPDKDIGLLLNKALSKVAFLPFGLLIDKWRWGVFDGSITPEHYNDAWVELRRKYQGIVPPVPRPADAFDPGAKAHIPGNTPYTRYFLSYILQFQFYKAACDQAGWTGPLNRCSYFNNKQVGANLEKMLAMGASKPWPDALEAFTGSREISAEPILEYFAPLKKWLDEQNKGHPSGW